MAKDFTKDLQRIFSYAREEAARLGNRVAGADHIFLGLLRDGENEATAALDAMGADKAMVRAEIESVLKEAESIPYEESKDIKFSQDIEDFYRNVSMEIAALHTFSPSLEVVLLAVLKDTSTTVAPILARSGITYDTLRDYIENKVNGSAKKKSINDILAERQPQEPFPYEEEPNPTPEFKINQNEQKPRQAQPMKTPNLDKFGTDLTAQAAAGRLDPVVGREKEIERLLQVLVRRKKNNPVLVGEAGVGKSAIVEGLAQRIVNHDVPPALQNKRLLTIDMGSVVAGTKYRGQFEERMRGIVEELKASTDTIIFIDELHTLVGAGAQAGSLDAANLLKPALARGELQCIGATTLDEYRQVIEKDGALERRFQKILVEPTDYEQTLAILQALKSKYEQHHNVTYTEEALKACVMLSSRYITDRMQPDKAIDVMDEAGARTNANLDLLKQKSTDALSQLETIREQKRLAASGGDFQQAAILKEKEESLLKEMDAKAAADAENSSKVLGEEQIASVVSMMTNIPVHRVSASEGERLLTMAANLKKQIVGQDDAVEAVVKAIQRNRAGLRDPGKPVGSFIFLGPTGVGKTYLAKKIAEYMFDSEDNLIRIDMSEYMERYSVSSLIGAPPGYVGYDQGGQLSEQVRRKPYSVVLFDEIEKAHQYIFNLLLQVLDEGRLTDAAGRHVDFRNTILIMTSNIGSKQASELGAGIGFKTATDDAPHRKNVIIEKALRRKFSPEFLNRIDDRILFNPLTKEDVEKILDIELGKFNKRVAQMGFDIKVSAATKAKIIEEGYDPEYGARPLKRAIQKYLEDPLAEKIIAGKKPSKC
ncbi:MAG: ATP-dependent Clp protease ATP-binding subunit [Bacteroidales bacterium]|nr:ATP-dependent Clp protease ATP-binding subunit [Bacteroidales bacterium]